MPNISEPVVAKRSTIPRIELVDQRLRVITRRQHGSLTAGQAVEAGLSYGALRKRASRGRIRQREQGVYTTEVHELTLEQECMVAMLCVDRPQQLGRRSGIGGRTALYLFGVHRFGARPIRVISPDRRRPRRSFVLTESRSLGAKDVTRIGRVPVTTPERSLVDAAAELTVEQLAHAIHELRYRHLLNDARLDACILRSASMRGIDRLRKALTHDRTGDRGTGSVARTSCSTCCPTTAFRRLIPMVVPTFPVGASTSTGTIARSASPWRSTMTDMAGRSRRAGTDVAMRGCARRATRCSACGATSWNVTPPASPAVSGRRSTCARMWIDDAQAREGDGLRDSSNIS
jgi:hypothetical protein